MEVAYSLNRSSKTSNQFYPWMEVIYIVSNLNEMSPSIQYEKTLDIIPHGDTPITSIPRAGIDSKTRAWASAKDRKGSTMTCDTSPMATPVGRLRWNLIRSHVTPHPIPRMIMTKVTVIVTSYASLNVADSWNPRIVELAGLVRFVNVWFVWVPFADFDWRYNNLDVFNKPLVQFMISEWQIKYIKNSVWI